MILFNYYIHVAVIF